MAEDDRQLLEAARSGDRAALERLLQAHQHRVFRFGVKMCGEEEDAKDVLQETLIAAARNIRDFRGASSVSTWLYTIARSFCIKKHRTSKFAPDHVGSLEEVPEQARAVLEPMYREVLVLRDVEGLSAAEVGEILGISVEAVKSRLHRARVAVRERVAPALMTEPGPAPAASCQDAVL